MGCREHASGGAHLDGVHGGSKDRIVVLDAAPELGPSEAGQIVAILLQNAQGLHQIIQRSQHLNGKDYIILNYHFQ